MIKRAAAAGAVAWTAPVIIDSLASPVAAATVAAGCYSIGFPHASICAPAVPPGTGSCNPPNWNPANPLPSGVVSPPAACPNNSNAVFTIPASDCVFVAANTGYQGGCVTSTAIVISNGGKTISFTRPGPSAWTDSAYRITVACGGGTCP
jgi:hypothetical protein